MTRDEFAGWLARYIDAWKSYDPDAPAMADAIIGEIGVTRQRLAPIGYIRVCGVLWRARVAGGGPPVEPGKPVKVEARHGLTLIVVPEEEVPSTREASQ